MMKHLAVLVLLLAPQEKPKPQELVVSKVAKLPAIDGKADDDAWKQAKELVVPIDQPGEEKPKKSVSLKGVHDGDSLCILAVWADADKSDMHAPFVLKGDAYEVDEERSEDRCILAFELEGKFDSNMKAGIESKWDVWEWGAARTNPVGYARDRMHIFAKTRPPEPIKSKRLTDVNEGYIFFARQDDEGTPCVKRVEAPKTKGAPIVPQYVPQIPSGSAADVQAKGEWANGKWTVEFKRKLNTGHKDDTQFDVNKPTPFAVAVFDKAEGMDHDVSGNLVLKFAK